MNIPYQIMVPSEERDRADLVVQIVALRFGTPVETVTRGGRLSASALRVRRVSLYLAHVALGWTLERVAHAFGTSRQTVGTACTRIENARDEPHLNDLLDQLADTIQTLCDAPPVTDLPDVA
ncbi:chromosomal replication initiator DnaA [Brevundimonas staleyi]|uniref:Chromosomal replication initiator DnaA n=1 Tax=Brevundimonas staleyi TaxID=74326 RepID=A0ABW0FQY7_9CAUL